MSSLQDLQMINQFENWFNERTVLSVNDSVATDELYNDYLKCTVEDENQQPLKRKTFVTIFKKYLSQDIKGARVSPSYKSKSAFQGIRLIADERVKRVELVGAREHITC